ncbi:endo-N-actetylneuraminidase [uncultured Mediterranean phage MEDS5 group]|uniref:Endo-N-actetylneuraminidase n=1 Tax=uncultured Mediterranean phage MEDS5 group TaxID=1262075 RepID=K7XS79_9CAUD|nr:endo-N-actetylneuraminidase [uncultured Mediterranean phage MEDS5 group]BAR24336.1 endo-N-actetylneuraminidase [uncultured Mediterranean phage uvMED]
MPITINGDSGLSGVNGSAGTPALQGTDSNTGIVFGTDTVQVSTGGTTRATVDSSGNITATGTAEFGGVLSVNRTGSGDGCFHAKLNGTTKASIASDGSATFVGGRAKLASDGNFELYNGSNQVVAISAGDGSATLADGNITFGGAGDATFAKVDAVFNSSSDVGLNLRNSSTGTSARFYSGSSIVGSITVSGSATAFNTSSDYRLKENVVGITDGITRVKQLSPSRFNFIADDTTTVDGFIAHEAQTVVPEAVTGEKDGEEMQGIDQSKLVPLLTAALQEAIGKIETLETQNASFEARLTALEGGAS